MRPAGATRCGSPDSWTADGLRQVSTLDAVAGDMFATIDFHDLVGVAAKLSPDVEFSAPGFEGRVAEAVIGFVAPFLSAFPDIHHEVANAIELGDMIAIELVITGTHTEPLAGLGGELPPDREAGQLQGRGCVARPGRDAGVHRVCFDTATVMAQLGFGAG
jgi:SnoaL-like polyketide cyclase